jgi:predicted TIM-barrel fold metal-dependent hydrolase
MTAANTAARIVSPLLALALAVAIPSPAAARQKAAAKARPILDTHIHIFQVTRPGGVPWPPPANKTLYKDFTVEAYKAMASQQGITGAVIVEASPIYQDNTKILEQIAADPFYRGLVGNLEVGKPDFVESLDKLSADPKLVGIRAFLWAPTLTLDPIQIAQVNELAKRGLTLDIISRGTLNPKDKVEQLAAAAPNLRIIIDHLAGAKGKTPNPEWTAAVKRLAKHKNIYIKFSSFFDMYNPAASEDNPWTAPTDLASYKPHFDVLYKAFGPDRLIYGTNYPVVTLGGTVAQHNALAEAYLAPLGTAVRDKVMYRNAEKFYARPKK